MFFSSLTSKYSNRFRPCEACCEYEIIKLKWGWTRAWFISSKVKIKGWNKLNVDESLSVPNHKIHPEKRSLDTFFFPLAAVYQSSTRWWSRFTSPGQTAAKTLKITSAKLSESVAKHISEPQKKKKRRYLPSKEDIHVHLLRLCKQAWKSGCTGMASPCGFDLQGPVQDPVIGCWRCCWVELRTANSHVSSGQPPPEHWALHRTASVGTRSRASRHRILNVALEAF